MPFTPRVRIAAALLVLLLVLAALVAWVRKPSVEAPRAQGAQRAAAALPVVLGTVSQAQDDAELDVLGSATALRSVTLYPAAAGEIAQLGFRAGQRVEANQVLMRLVDRPQALAVDLAGARLQAARNLLARYEATRGTGAVPGSVVDEARTNVALAEIELRQAREALADRVLRAPFAGVVGLSEVEPGDRVSLETAIATLDDRRTILVNFEVPETYATRIRVGQPLTVGNPAFGGRRFAGNVALIDSRVDEVSRNLRLRAVVPNPDDVLRPGMSFQVRLSLPGGTFMAVPALALQWDREGAYVWVVREAKALRVPARPVRRGPTHVLVEGALQAGEQVVVEGVQRLRPGAAVAPVQPGAPQAQAPAPAASAAAGVRR